MKEQNSALKVPQFNAAGYRHFSIGKVILTQLKIKVFLFLAFMAIAHWGMCWSVPGGGEYSRGIKIDGKTDRGAGLCALSPDWAMDEVFPGGAQSGSFDGRMDWFVSWDDQYLYLGREGGSNDNATIFYIQASYPGAENIAIAPNLDNFIADFSAVSGKEGAGNGINFIVYFKGGEAYFYYSYNGHWVDAPFNNNDWLHDGANQLEAAISWSAIPSILGSKMTAVKLAMYQTNARLEDGQNAGVKVFGQYPVNNPGNSGASSYEQIYTAPMQSMYTLDIPVKSAPSYIKEVTGHKFLCPGETNIAYQVIGGNWASNFQWVLPSGISMVAQQDNGKSVRLSVSSGAGMGSKEIVVRAQNSCGEREYRFDVVIGGKKDFLKAEYSGSKLKENISGQLVMTPCLDEGSTCHQNLKDIQLGAKLDLGEEYFYSASMGSYKARASVHIKGLNHDRAILFERDFTLKVNENIPENLFTESLKPYLDNLAILDYSITYLGDDVVKNKARLQVYAEKKTTYDVENAQVNLLNMVPSPLVFEQTFSWESNCSAVENYQFQLLRLYNKSANALTEKDWNNAVNIETQSKATSLELVVAEGSGEYAWRVRALGNYPGGITNPVNWGQWSNIGTFNYTQADKDKNWIYSRTFLEGNKVKEQLSYANGLKQVRQQQTRLQSTRQVLAVQTLQDYSGRNALTSLPVPVAGKMSLGYHDRLLATSGNGLFKTEHFDKEPFVATGGALKAFESGGFYSGNDVVVDGKVVNADVASAQGYPYSRTIFNNDATGRVKEQAGPGLAHSLEGGKTIKTYYAEASNDELRLLFGNEAPKAKDVQKTITLDANNTGSVSYHAKTGESLATALIAGTSSDALLPAGSDKLTIREEITDKVPRGIFGSSSRKSFVFTTAGTIHFEYKITAQALEDICSNLCTTCDYTVEFYLHNLDDRNSPTGSSISRLALDQEIIIQPGDCQVPQEREVSMAVNIPYQGTYILEKRVRTNNLNENGVRNLTALLNEVRETLTREIDTDLASVLDFINVNDYDGLYEFLDFKVLEDEKFAYFDDEDDPYYQVEVMCGEFIHIPHLKDNCPPNPCAMTPQDLDFEGYFENFWQEKGMDPKYWRPQGSAKVLPYISPSYGEFKSGQLNAMMVNMLNEDYGFPLQPKFYTCEMLWEVWVQQVASYELRFMDMRGAIGSASDGKVDIPVEFDLLKNFFMALDAKIKEGKTEEDIAAFAWRTYLPKTEYHDVRQNILPKSEHAYKQFAYDHTNNRHWEILQGVIILYNRSLPANQYCDTTDRKGSGFYCLDAYHQFLAFQSITHAAEVSEDIDEDYYQKKRQKVIDQCLEACENRRESFRMSVIDKVHELGYYVEGDAYTLEYDEFLNKMVASGTPRDPEDFEVSLCQVNLMVEELIERCNSDCELYFIYGTLDDDTQHIIGLGTPEQQERVQKAMLYNYDLQLLEGGGGTGTSQRVGDPLSEDNYAYLYGNELFEGHQEILDVYIDKEQNAFVRGVFKGESGLLLSDGELVHDYHDWFLNFVIKFDAQANYEWILRLPYPSNNVNQGFVFKEEKQAFYITGAYFQEEWSYENYFSSSKNDFFVDVSEINSPFYVLKANANGYIEWVKDLKAEVSSEGSVSSFMVDAEENFYFFDHADNHLVKQNPFGDIVWRVYSGVSGSLVRYFLSSDNTIFGVSESFIREYDLDGELIAETPIISGVSGHDFPYQHAHFNKRYFYTTEGEFITKRGVEGLVWQIPATTFLKDLVDIQEGHLVFLSTSNPGADPEDLYLTTFEMEQGRLFKETLLSPAHNLPISNAYLFQSLVYFFGTSYILNLEFNESPIRRWFAYRAVMEPTVPCYHNFILDFRWKEQPPQINIPPGFEDYVLDRESIPCEQLVSQNILNTVNHQINEIINRRVEEHKDLYMNRCVDINQLNDEFTVIYDLGYHHFTLYYYDRAGRLIKTVPPKGAKPDGTNTHDLVTLYHYNSLGQLIRQHTPDANVAQRNDDKYFANFYYDNLGQLRFSQNAKQKQEGSFSYTKYDELGRIIEVGESKERINHFFRFVNDELFPESGYDKTVTVYSQAGPVRYLNGSAQRYLLNRVSYTYTDTDGNGETLNDRTYTYYSYDPHGNVEWLCQRIPRFNENGLNTPSYIDAYVAYEYDLLSGNVLKVSFNEGHKDAFYHKYSYDEDNRIKAVYTSPDGKLWDRDANYEYYAHGPLKRTVIGKDKVQGLDYIYTVQGWLKGINHPTLLAFNDPGRDGSEGSMAKDAFGMGLGYYKDDYVRSGSSYAGNSGGLEPTRDLYNGNISTWTSQAMKGSGTQEVQYQHMTGHHFVYDELNRIRESQFMTNSSGNPSSWASTEDYKTKYRYDANGNITHLERHGFGAHHLKMDDLVYHYYQGTNKLEYVTDDASLAQNYEEDIDGQSPGNYTYDDIGNLISDKSEQIKHISWTPYGKVKKIEKEDGSSIVFNYDASGSRVSKHVIDCCGLPSSGTYYVRDASGNVMAIYEEKNKPIPGGYESTLLLKEQPVYGSDRLGQRYPNIELGTLRFVGDAAPVTIDRSQKHQAEYKRWSVPVRSARGSSLLPLHYSQGDMVNGVAGPTIAPADIRAVAVAESEKGDLLFNLSLVPVLNQYANVALLTDAHGHLMPGSAGLNSPGIKASARTRPLAMKNPVGNSTYLLFTMDDQGHAYAHNIEMGLKGNGTEQAPRGEVQKANRPVHDQASFLPGMALVEDQRSGQSRGLLYLLRNNHDEENKEGPALSLVSFGFGKYSDDNIFPNFEEPLVLDNFDGGYDHASMVVSPDGHYLAVLVGRGGYQGWYNTIAQGYELRLYTLTGSLEGASLFKRLHFGEHKAIHSLDFSKDGLWLYFTSSSPSTGAAIERLSIERLICPEPGQPATPASTPLAVQAETVQVLEGYAEVVRAKNGKLYAPVRGTQQFFEISHGKEKVEVTLLPVALPEDLRYSGVMPGQVHKVKRVNEAEELNLYARKLGEKRYELKDHLGNVRAVISDRKLADGSGTSFSNFRAELKAAYNYYPFGMMMPGRSFNSTDYRYGFNGMEKDDEVKGSGNSYTTHYRMYDSRLGMWLSVDPKAVPWESPYVGMGDNPIINIDPKGDFFFGLFGSTVSQRRMDRAEDFANKTGGVLRMENGKPYVTVVSADEVEGGMVITSYSKFGDFSSWKNFGDTFRRFDKELEGNYDGANSGTLSKGELEFAAKTMQNTGTGLTILGFATSVIPHPVGQAVSKGSLAAGNLLSTSGDALELSINLHHDEDPTNAAINLGIDVATFGAGNLIKSSKGVTEQGKVILNATVDVAGEIGQQVVEEKK
jgi:RHS repeat-associated protein